MTKKKLYLLVALPVILLLAGCASLNLPGASTTTQQNPMDFKAQPVEGKLAIGIFKLEGTDKAITAAQAKELLPLWKAVKSLSASQTTSPEEQTALYQQIQESLTADQLQVIKDMNLSPEDMQALMKANGIEAPKGGIGAPQGTPDPSRMATWAARSSGTTGSGGATGSGGFRGGEFPGGGMPPDGGGMPPDGSAGGMGGFNSSQPRAQGTPQAGQTANRGMRGGGMNMMFIDPLIKLLEKRAGA